MTIYSNILFYFILFYFSYLFIYLFIYCIMKLNQILFYKMYKTELLAKEKANINQCPTNAISQSTSTLWDVHIKTMASLIEALTTLDETELIETRIRCFAAPARVKKLKDEKASRGENEITNLFLSTTGCEVVKKISTMAYPRELEELTYEAVVRIIRKNIRLKKKISCH